MAKKEKPQEQGPQAAPKKPPKGNGGILLPVLFAAIVGFACFLIILGVGGMVSEHNAQTADAPSAQPSSPEALPTQRPTNAPTQDTVGSEEPVPPDETDEPTATDPPQDLPSNPAVQTQAPTSTRAPPAQTNPPAATQAPAQPVQTRAPTAQNPGPVVSIQPTAPTAPPVQQTQRPAQQTQAPAQTGNQGGEGGNQSTYSRDNGVAGTFLGTVNSDKYHSGNCSAARRIPPENEVWYNSEAEARAAGRDRCGICWR